MRNFYTFLILLLAIQFGATKNHPRNHRKLGYTAGSRLIVNLLKDIPVLNYFAFSENIFNSRKQLTEIKKMVQQQKEYKEDLIRIRDKLTEFSTREYDQLNDLKMKSYQAMSESKSLLQVIENYNRMNVLMESMKPGDRYQFIRILGKGSYGVVGEYFDTEKKQKVAIKKLNEVVDITDAKRMLREIRILNSFSHDNILKLKYVLAQPNDNKFFDIYLVTDLWDIDLSKIIKKNHADLTDDHVQYILYQIFSALQLLHSSKVIHRDMKPTNILANESCDVCLCDFGFAREIAEFSHDLTEYVITRFYRAPEVMLSSQKYDTSVDIWSVGCTLYELITGHPLFQSKHYLELIQLMIKKLGTPDQDSLNMIQNPQAVDFIMKQPYVPPRKISEKLKGYSNPQALDLLDRCLTFNPSHRITAEEAMRHPYFQEIFEEEHIKKPVIIDFSFEKKGHITLEELKVEIIQEIADLNLKKGETFHEKEFIEKHMSKN